jgi:hypothetical protein
LAVAGGWLAMSTAQSDRSLDPVRRELAAFLPRRIKVGRGEETPRQLSVIAVSTSVGVTFAEGCVPRHPTVELLVSCWAGRVEVRAPGSWLLAAGRVAATRGIRFVGDLDHHRPFPDPRAPEQAERLGKLIQEHHREHPPPDSDIPAAVLVVHVLGFGGEVTILREHQ